MEAPDTNAYLPSLQDIYRACLRIQQGWSERERRRREHDSHLECSQEEVDDALAVRLLPTMADPR